MERGASDWVLVGGLVGAFQVKGEAEANVGVCEGGRGLQEPGLR